MLAGKHLIGLLVAGAFLILSAPLKPAQPQLSRVPVHAAGVPNVNARWSLYGLASQGGDRTWAVSARGDRLLGSKLTVGGGLGAFWPSGAEGREAQGQIEVRVVRALLTNRMAQPTFAVAPSLGVAVAWTGDDQTEVNVPVSLEVAGTVPFGGISLDWWGSPRVALRRSSGPDESSTQIGLGLSAGAVAGRSRGAALYLGLDWTALDHVPVTTGSSSAFVMGLGLRVRL